MELIWYKFDEGKNLDPKFYSGAVLDLYLPENYPLETLKGNLQSFADGAGTNIMTITVADRKKL